MGRLEDIIQRNRNPKGNRERTIVMLGLGLFLLLILSLMVFTDLGKAKAPPTAPPSKDHHVDDVPLGAPRAK